MHFEGWTPGADEIAGMEAKMAERPMPLGSLDRYARYYAGAGDGGRRTIWGTLIPAGGNDPPGAHVVEPPPLLMAEGCATTFDANRAQLIYFNCQHRGAWRPAITQVSELEDLLHHHGGPRLEQYLRYYVGREVIEGYFRMVADYDAGVYIGSGYTLMFDGGCAFFTVTYDTSSKATTWKCNGPHGPNVIDEGAYDPSSGKTTYKCSVATPRAQPPSYWRGPSGYVPVSPPSLPSDCCTLPTEFRAPDSGIVEIVNSRPRSSEDREPSHPLSICSAR
jgi:hypothetical protein